MNTLIDSADTPRSVPTADGKLCREGEGFVVTVTRSGRGGLIYRYGPGNLDKHVEHALAQFLTECGSPAPESAKVVTINLVVGHAQSYVARPPKPEPRPWALVPA